MHMLKYYALLGMALLLSACTSTVQRDYEACIVGSSALGGMVGGGAGNAAAGVAVGAAAGAVICRYEPPKPVAAEPADSDGDGVSDDRDRCPGTPRGVEVDTNGCPLDTDGDGVANYLDRCPNTPAGVRVDGQGCPVKDEVVLTIDHLNFAFDSAELDASARAALDAAVAVIRDHREVSMDVVGHTDSTGPEAYNQGLSERRAQAAVDYLVSKGVDRAQLRAAGRGEAQPIAGNDTRDGRARNRRVELVVR